LLGGRGPPSSAYNFYYEVRSNVKLRKAINQATTRREKKVLDGHRNARLASHATACGENKGPFERDVAAVEDTASRMRAHGGARASRADDAS
jgi:hypothetical protein